MKILLNIVISAVVIVGLVGFYVWLAYDSGRSKGRIEGRTEGDEACLKAVRETAAEIRAEREKFTIDDITLREVNKDGTLGENVLEKDFDSSDWMMQKDKHGFGEAYNVLRPQPLDDETERL